jgi:crotonobetainyl-CoA:carnitine CoA-transferase CaiB-like acyl-CoA transferase
VAEGPLTGTRVLELATLLAGPFCGKILAGYGADVVKVEPPTGDPMRSLGPFDSAQSDREFGGLFRSLNAGKRSVTADLEVATGRELLRQLVATADIVIEDFEPGRLEALSGDLWELRPSLVIASITPFGQHGPHANWRGGDLIACAAGGLAHLTGDPEREPLAPGGLQADHLAGLQAAAGSLLALFHARRSGSGQRVDVSRQEAVIGVLESTVSAHGMNGQIRGRMGTHHPAVHGLGLQQLRDGNWVLVGTLPTERMWDSARILIGDPDWAQEERWRDARHRREHADEIDRLAAPRFAELTTEEIYPQMKRGGVPVGLVRDMESARHSPQLLERSYFSASDDLEEESDETQLGPPWRMSATPWRPAGGAPSLGSHNHDVYVNGLGHSAADLERWRRAGVI